MTTCTDGSWALIIRVASIPSSTGMRMSISTTSGMSSTTSCVASRPSEALPTTVNPSSVRRSHRASSRPGSSSATRTRARRPPRWASWGTASGVSPCGLGSWTSASAETEAMTSRAWFAALHASKSVSRMLVPGVPFSRNRNTRPGVDAPASASSSYADSRTTWVAGRRRLISLAASTPPITRIRTSSTTTSGSSRTASSTASRPLRASSSTIIPYSSIRARRLHRNASLSSAIRIRGRFPEGWAVIPALPPGAWRPGRPPAAARPR